MNTRIQNAFIGSLVADAVAMPVHWYYNTAALDEDFPNLAKYEAPKPIHPDSILWRSKYRPRNKEADILRDQAQYWGQREVHYHQFLKAGDNTLNYQLAAELYKTTVARGSYDAQAWLKTYVDCMLTDGWHNDTYVEEYHRAFFDNRAQRKPLEKCGIDDVHIGGLAPVPALLAALDTVDAIDIETILQHVSLTHRNHHVVKSTRALVAMIKDIAEGSNLRDAIAEHGRPWAKPARFEAWAKQPDRITVGRELSSACYLPGSFTASLALAWKYADTDFSASILANAKVGGDNCHRGAVVGALLGAAHGIEPYWLENLNTMQRLRSVVSLENQKHSLSGH